MERRKFIKSCVIGCSSMATIALTLESCGTSAYYAKTTLAGSSYTIAKSEFVVVNKNKTIDRKYVLIRPATLGYPICIYKIGPESYSALLMECTHKSCELQPQSTFLVCPCHGSEFTSKGEVQNPPAERNLKTFPITTDSENIYLQL